MAALLAGCSSLAMLTGLLRSADPAVDHSPRTGAELEPIVVGPNGN